MAIVNVSFDTVKKTLDVKIDGKEVKDISYLSFDNYCETSCMSMTQKSTEEDGITTYTNLYASEKGLESTKSAVSPLSKSLATLMKR